MIGRPTKTPLIIPHSLRFFFNLDSHLFHNSMVRFKANTYTVRRLSGRSQVTSQLSLGQNLVISHTWLGLGRRATKLQPHRFKAHLKNFHSLSLECYKVVGAKLDCFIKDLLFYFYPGSQVFFSFHRSIEIYTLTSQLDTCIHYKRVSFFCLCTIIWPRYL